MANPSQKITNAALCHSRTVAKTVKRCSLITATRSEKHTANISESVNYTVVVT